MADFLLFSSRIISTKVLIDDTFFTRDRQVTWSSEPREGLANCRAKEVSSFLSYFKTLNIGPVPGIEPSASISAVK